MKLLSRREPICEVARVSTTRVIEKTVPATPIDAPAIVDNILRAESALPEKIYLKTRQAYNPGCYRDTVIQKQKRRRG